MSSVPQTPVSTVDPANAAVEQNWKVKLWKLVDGHQAQLAQLRDALARDLIATEDKLTAHFSEGVKQAVSDFNTSIESIVAENPSNVNAVEQ